MSRPTTLVVSYLLPLLKEALPGHLLETGDGDRYGIHLLVGGELLGIASNSPRWWKDTRPCLAIGQGSLRLPSRESFQFTDGRLSAADEARLRAALAHIKAPAFPVSAEELTVLQQSTDRALRALPCVLRGRIELAGRHGSDTHSAWSYVSDAGLKFPLLSYTLFPLLGLTRVWALHEAHTVDGHGLEDARNAIQKALSKNATWLAGKAPMTPEAQAEFRLAATGSAEGLFGEIASCKIVHDQCDEWLSSDVVLRLPVLAAVTEALAEKWVEANWLRIQKLLPEVSLKWTGNDSEEDEAPRSGQSFPNPKHSRFSDAEVTLQVRGEEAVIRIGFSSRDR